MHDNNTLAECIIRHPNFPARSLPVKQTDTFIGEKIKDPGPSVCVKLKLKSRLTHVKEGLKFATP